MTRSEVGLAIARSALYIYVSIGASLLANGILFAIWLNLGGTDKNFPPVIGALTFFGVLFVLVAGSRDDFGRRINLRWWIPLCVLSTLALVPSLLLLFATTSSITRT